MMASTSRGFIAFAGRLTTLQWHIPRSSCKAIPSRLAGIGAIRNLNLREFPTMKLLNEYGIRTPRCYLTSDPEEARKIHRQHFSKEKDGYREAFLKAQVLLGERQRGRGVFDNGSEGSFRLISHPDEAFDFAHQMLGRKTVDANSQPYQPKDKIGVLCRSVMLVERIQLQRKLYLSILMDRNSQGPILIGSASCRGGGWNGSYSLQQKKKNNHNPFICSDAVAGSLSFLQSRNPDSVFTEHIDIMDGLELDQCERMAENLGLDANTKTFDQAVNTMVNLYSLFVQRDCTMIEVNPLGVESETGEAVVVEARVQFDDNAAFRQESIFSQLYESRKGENQRDPQETRAKQEGIDYIGLPGSGNIGCMVNGAGLAMATMDLIHSKGGNPSNFLDIGGGNCDTVQAALSLLERDPNVEVILINIFGGLMRCDVIANGIIGFSRAIGIQKPVVLRLQGTNYEDAQFLIAEYRCGRYGQNTISSNSNNDIRLVDDLEEAIDLAVVIAKDIVERSSIEEGWNEWDVDDPLELSALVQHENIAETEELVAMAALPQLKRMIPEFKGFSL